MKKLKEGWCLCIQQWAWNHSRSSGPEGGRKSWIWGRGKWGWTETCKDNLEAIKSITCSRSCPFAMELQKCLAQDLKKWWRKSGRAWSCCELSCSPTSSGARNQWQCLLAAATIGALTDLQRLMVAYTFLLLNLMLSSLMANLTWKPYRGSMNHSSN